MGARGVALAIAASHRARWWPCRAAREVSTQTLCTCRVLWAAESSPEGVLRCPPGVR